MILIKARREKKVDESQCVTLPPRMKTLLGIFLMIIMLNLTVTHLISREKSKNE